MLIPHIGQVSENDVSLMKDFIMLLSYEGYGSDLGTGEKMAEVTNKMIERFGGDRAYLIKTANNPNNSSEAIETAIGFSVSSSFLLLNIGMDTSGVKKIDAIQTFYNYLKQWHKDVQIKDEHALGHWKMTVLSGYFAYLIGAPFHKPRTRNKDFGSWAEYATRPFNSI